MISAEHSTRPRIPVVLVTGFLGSGKTTVVNRMLKSQAYARAAVVVNEFGEVSVDHALIDAPRRRLRVIDGGCLCGHVHEEVATRLLDLLEQRTAGGEAYFDRVLIETSGLADPVPIMQILQTDAAVASAFELRAVVAVCDAVHGEDHLSNHDASLKQAAVADLLVISKCDIAHEEQIATLSTHLGTINPGTMRVEATYGSFDLTVLDGIRNAPSSRSAEAQAWLNDDRYAATHMAASEDPTIHTFTLTHDEPATIPGLVLWINLLAGFRGGGLLRVKGIVNVEGRPYAVQAVQTIVSEPVPLERWPDGHDRRSRLVFITRGIAPDAIRRTFSTFAFEGARARRNLVIRPETYAHFKHAMEVFRDGAKRSRKAPPRLDHSDFNTQAHGATGKPT